MKKLSYSLVIAALACMLAFAAGCSSSSDSASASAAASGSASGSAAPAASGPLDAANLADGEYQVEAILGGGSGRATIESPAKLNVNGGNVTAVIVWSSPHYTQMIVGGQQYLPVPRSGNSTFEIPVLAFDEDLEIQAETTAMSEPHMIDYTLRFDSSTLTQ